jgi:Putative peptidoglycan binding domain
LDLALARIKNNLGQLRGPVQRSAHGALTRRIAGRVKLAHLRYYLGAALFAALVGIGVNALLLQRERHPAPLFGYAAPKLPSAPPAPAPPPPQKPASTEDNAPPAPPAPSSAALPPARPAESAGSSSPASDPIAELLAGEPHGDASRLTLAAQTALAKLGYPVKPDGKEGSATEQALREFERAHGLPPATEITERLVKQLTAAARAGGH